MIDDTTVEHAISTDIECIVNRTSRFGQKQSAQALSSFIPDGGFLKINKRKLRYRSMYDWIAPHHLYVWSAARSTNDFETLNIQDGRTLLRAIIVLGYFSPMQE